MCLPISDASMIAWLRHQLIMLEAWREQLASSPELDLKAVCGVENHYQWLCSEIARLEDGRRQAA